MGVNDHRVVGPRLDLFHQQDDAHVFCREEQVESEVIRFCRLLRRAHARLGFERFEVGFSTRSAAALSFRREN